MTSDEAGRRATLHGRQARSQIATAGRKLSFAVGHPLQRSSLAAQHKCEDRCMQTTHRCIEYGGRRGVSVPHFDWSKKRAKHKRVSWEFCFDAQI